MKTRRNMFMGALVSAVLVAAALGIQVRQAWAGAELSLRSRVVAEGMELGVFNAGTQRTVFRVNVELDGRDAGRSGAMALEPGQERFLRFAMQGCDAPGARPAIFQVRYLADSQAACLAHVGACGQAGPEDVEWPRDMLHEDVMLEDAVLQGARGEVVLVAEDPSKWRLVLPLNMEVVAERIQGSRRVFTLERSGMGLRDEITFHALAQGEEGGRAWMRLATAHMVWDATVFPRQSPGRLPWPWGLGALMGFAALGAAVLLRSEPGTWATALGKYAGRMVLVLAAYLALQNAAATLDHLALRLPWTRAAEAAGILAQQFHGLNYAAFFRWFMDPFVLACALICLPYARWADQDRPLAGDKYAAVLHMLLTLPGMILGRRPRWDRAVRLGLLTFGVKGFFLPLLLSWACMGLGKSWSMASLFIWDFWFVNALLVALFLLVDTVVYSIGYAVELRSLKNEIRSVEPTLLGWVVCLWCYPPFNLVGFLPFEYGHVSVDWPDWVPAAATAVGTALWFVYAWASVALGFKASNLTNRGIVGHGPYRVVRHPAYVSKNAFWLLQVFFLGQGSVGVAVAALAVYWLRSLTEERHLSMDPDYLEYKRRVRWLFVPGVY